MEPTIKLSQCVKDLKLEVINGKDYLDRDVTRPMLSSPGVEIYAGYFEFYDFNRIQIIGSKEMNLFYMLDEETRKTRIKKLFEFNPPAFIFTVNVEVVPEVFIECSNEYKIPLIKSKKRTSQVHASLGSYLSSALAIRKNMHGTMMDINGVGVMITGKSKIGKSEAALELLNKGHTLVCDDCVEVSEPSEGMIEATCPKNIERMMEVRGLGIVDVVELFGVKAFRNKKRLMLIVELVKLTEDIKIDRLGLEEEYETIFNTKIPKVTIYVLPGRNLASLIEVAAMNWRLKSFGKNTSLDFVNKINNIVKGGK